jgi:hypothetical protein
VAATVFRTRRPTPSLNSVAVQPVNALLSQRLSVVLAKL